MRSACSAAGYTGQTPGRVEQGSREPVEVDARQFPTGEPAQVGDLVLIGDRSATGDLRLVNRGDVGGPIAARIGPS